MPNQPSIHKRVLSLQIPRNLYYSLKQASVAKQLDLAVYIRQLLSEATSDIKLTKESLEAIRVEEDKALAKRKRKAKAKTRR